MNRSHFAKSYKTKNGHLHLFAMDTEQSQDKLSELDSIVGREVDVLAPFILDKEQFLYVRNNQMLCIDGKLPAGHTYFPHESMVAIPSWKDLSIVETQAVIAHELHHMARWQNAGYGNTLGGALTSEGIATYYEEVRTGRRPLWSKTKLTKMAREEALKCWDDANYDHGEWFFDGPHGRWVGYSLGYELAKRYFTTFDIKQSVELTAAELKQLL